MMGQGPPPDLSNAEIVDYEVEDSSGGRGRVRLKLKDGATIEIRLEIMNILRAGNDPNTGLPNYIVQSAPMVRLVDCPPELRKQPLKPGSRDPKALPGPAYA